MVKQMEALASHLVNLWPFQHWLETIVTFWKFSRGKNQKKTFNKKNKIDETSPKIFY